MPSPLISLIVSLYNQSAKFEKLLETLLDQQNAPPFELILCDDGSKAADVASVINNSRSRLNCEVIHVWQSDIGFRLSRSRNNGIRCARGELLIFIDGDVLLPPEFLQGHARAHTRGKMLVCGDRKSIFPRAGSRDNDRVEVDFVYFSKCLTASARDRCPWAALLGCNFSVANSTEVRFDENFRGWGFEDWELSCRLMEMYAYEIVSPMDLTVTHLEDHCISEHHATRPHTTTDIAAFVNNLVYMCNMYPQLDMTEAWSCLRNYTPPNENSSQWVRDVTDEGSGLTLADKISYAQEWARGRFAG